MPYTEIALPPGVYKNGTERQGRGRWFNSHLVRFFEGTIRPDGGWETHATGLTGKARAMLTWADNTKVQRIAVGTHSKLEIVDRVGTVYDVTPVRRTQVRANPLTTVNTSATVTITDAVHGAGVGDYVNVSGAAAVGGITVSGWYQILTVPTANTFTVLHSAAATSGAVGGGATVTLTYQITVGSADPVVGGGYGSGSYGAGAYGVSGSSPGLVTPCTVWSLDTFGENLIAGNASDGKLYKWTLNTSTPAALVAGAPTQCRAFVATDERTVMALGAGGDPRVVQWCDIEDETNWTAGLPSIAGSFPIQTAGKLMCGRRVRGGTLLLTDVDAHLAVFNDPSNPYSFERVGADCGVISQGAAVVASDTLCAWMGATGFFAYDGSVRPIPCDVGDYVFSDLNITLASKFTAVVEPAYGEISWYYASSGASENDRYVRWNFRENHWVVGALVRTCGAARGVFPHPLLCDASGNVWAHESNYTYTGAASPFLESGPIEMGDGDNVYTALNLIPDEKLLGSVAATFYSRFYPTGTESTFGSFTIANPTNVRFTGRQVRMRLTGATATDWRVGGFRLQTKQGGRR
jgi:hypothetical protein